MNPLLFPPTLIKRALDDLGAIAERRPPPARLEEQVLERIDTHRGAGAAPTSAARIASRSRRCAATSRRSASCEQVREGIEPLDEDMRAVRARQSTGSSRC